MTQDEAAAEHTEPEVSMSLTAVRFQPERLRQGLSEPGIWKGPSTAGDRPGFRSHGLPARSALPPGQRRTPKVGFGAFHPEHQRSSY